MKSFRRLVQIFVAVMLVLMIDAQAQAGQAATAPPPNCRFGITTPYGLDSQGEVQALQAGSYLDWGTNPPSKLPAGVDYINVLRVGDRCNANPKIICSSSDPINLTMFNQTLNSLQANLKSHPLGSYWEIGNEPDTSYSTQDDITAQAYADRFYTLATQIHTYDPSAKVGFGSVVQPTPIRMRYLDKAWTELIADEEKGPPQLNLADATSAASALIDFWDIHSFILNELPGQWGTGVPPGFENDHADAQAINDWPLTYSIVQFSTRVQAFRKWMAGKGEQNKPLWITEYGSLLPPVNHNGSHNVLVSDALTANFMTATFNFMLNTTNPQTGMPDDNYHLVQRWFWYSMNDHRWSLGGALYDQDNNDAITAVGQAFVKYQPKQAAAPDYAVEQPSVIPNASDATQFQISFNLLDSGNDTAPAGVKWYVYSDNPNGAAVATFTTPRMSGCGETRTITANLPYFPTTSGNLFIEADTTGDTNPANNLVEVNGPPNVAYNLSALARSTNKIVLRWNNSGGNNNSFGIDRSPNGVSGWSALSGAVQNTGSYTDQGSSLKPGTPYYYRLRVAINGTTWYSNIASDTTQGTGAPPAPTSVAAQVISNRQVSLSWNNPYDNTQYHVERSKDNSSWSEVAVLTGVDTVPYVTVYVDKGLDTNQKYYYRVRAGNSTVGYSGYTTSSPLYVTTYRYGVYLPLF